MVNFERIPLDKHNVGSGLFLERGHLGMKERHKHEELQAHTPPTHPSVGT